MKTRARCTTTVLVSLGLGLLVLASCSVPGSSSESNSGVIQGTIAIAGQSDLSGAIVTAEQTDGVKTVSIQQAIASRGLQKGMAVVKATTDSSGAYTLRGLPSGTYSLSATSKDGLSKGFCSSVSVSQSSTTQALLMTLTETGLIKGTAVLKDAPSSSLGIVVFVAGTSYSAMTDASGNFLMSYVPAGKNYTLVATMSGYDPAFATVNVKVNSTTTKDNNNNLLAFQLSRSKAQVTTGSVAGTATLSGASSGQNAGIFVYLTTDLTGTSYIGATNSNGTFTLSSVAPGTYTATASKPGYDDQTSTVTVVAGETASLVFTPLQASGPALTAPAAPTGLATNPSFGSTSPIVSWNASDGATGYVLSRATSATGPFATIFTGSATSFQDSGLAADSSYYYEVQATNSAGSSPVSGVLTYTTANQIY